MKKIFYVLCAALFGLCIGLSSVKAKEVTLDEFVDKFQKEVIDSMDPDFIKMGYSLSIKKVSATEVKINEHQDKNDKTEERSYDVYFKYDDAEKSFSYDRTTTTTPDDNASLTKFNCSYRAHKIMDYALLVLGELSGHTEEEVRNFLASDEALDLTYEKNGIEYSFKKAGELEGYKEFEAMMREDANNDQLDLSAIPMFVSLKGNLANLFKDVDFSVTDDEDKEEPELPDEGEGDLPNDDEDNITDDTEEEEPEKNPSTGDSKINLILITITLMGGLSYIGYRRYKELKD